MPDQTSARLLVVLAKERTAIRTADFAELDLLAVQKFDLFEALPRSGTSESDLVQIKTKLIENQTLLSAAISGVAAAQDRIAALRNVREGLSVYDQSGQIAKVTTRRPGVEKKA
jgi:hypothetical protein